MGMLRESWLALGCRCGVLALATGVALALPRPCIAEPSLANLLGAAPADSDPTSPYAHELATLQHRPFARDADVQGALEEARTALAKARAAYRRRAPEAEVRRALELVRAALSVADRLEARAFTAAALARLEARAQEAEAAAELAQRTYEQVAGSGLEVAGEATAGSTAAGEASGGGRK